MADEDEFVTEDVNEGDEQVVTEDYIQFLGDGPHGTDFLTSHTLPKGDALWKRNGVDGAKEIVWERDPMGPGIGQKGNRMLVPVSEIPPAQLEVLEKTPGFKRVSG